ncbi:MAG: hypothetical protein M1150_03285 [Patescibacteria group bacterium]|nr:hypothetical protein [Patescibacteria group bacterium]
MKNFFKLKKTSKAKSSTFHKLHRKLLKRHEAVVEDLKSKHQESLKWLEKKGKSVDDLTSTAAQTATASAITGMLLLSPGTGKARELPQPKPAMVNEATPGVIVDKIEAKLDKGIELSEKLKKILPEKPQPLTRTQAGQASQAIEEMTGIKAVQELEGKKLNTDYGFVGAEQHLYRFPGDTLTQHAENAQDWLMYGQSGIAPHLGAWGYFSEGHFGLTKDARDRERWYLVAQTFLAPGWKDNYREMYEWFKFRKMIMINPETGQGVVGALGDSGPAEWTGKSFGASPEGMEFLDLGGGPRKGKVILFFVDDPENKVPLGPINGEEK